MKHIMAAQHLVAAGPMPKGAMWSFSQDPQAGGEATGVDPYSGGAGGVIDHRSVDRFLPDVRFTHDDCDCSVCYIRRYRTEGGVVLE